MLLDEPNTHLDLRHQVEMARLLRRLSKERQIGILMATHDLNLASMSADRLILLKDGKVASHGSPAQVLEPSIVSQIYGVPMRRIDLPHGAGPVLVPDVGFG